MKCFRSLRLQLMSLFALLLIVFSLLMAFVFNMLMQQQMIEHYSQSMQHDAHAIAQNLSELVVPSEYASLDETRFLVSEGTLAPYLSMTELLTNSNIYLVDSSHNVTGYFSGVVQTLINPHLPLYLEQTIALGFMGKTPSVQAVIDGEVHLTASMPVMNADSRVLGVVVLETTLRELGYSQVPSVPVLIASCLAAFGLSVLLALIFSRLFTRPISQVEQLALALAAGDYEARTPIRRSNNEIVSLARSMDILAEKLQEARHLEAQQHIQQQRLFSNISHELRTPVTVIRGSLEALRDGVVSSETEVQAYYEQMIRESRWLQHLIRDLLELSRLQSDEYVLNQSQLDLAELLGDVAMSTRALCDQKGVLFHCDEPTISYSFTGDYTRLRQMLLAVCDNAVKFTPAGGSVRLDLSSKSPVITVEDTGVGIAPEDLNHIFDRFHSARDAANESTGLGLAIVREIARRHSIEITVESQPGKGTVFTFAFPVDFSSPL